MAKGREESFQGRRISIMKAKDFGAPEELWNENVAICKRCGKPIAFAKDENGRWVVLEPDFRSFHSCTYIKEVNDE